MALFVALLKRSPPVPTERAGFAVMSHDFCAIGSLASPLGQALEKLVCVEFRLEPERHLGTGYAPSHAQLAFRGSLR